jgi:alpha-ketoglutarate-dependent taurine dioxygenase
MLNEVTATGLEQRELSPFGIVLSATQPGVPLATLSVEGLRRLTWRHRVVVLRGFALMDATELERYSRQWGDLLEWPFGYVLELEAREEPKNYLFTRGNVPFHWDGAFAAREPSFLVFQCRRAPPHGAGGESLFCDTIRVCQNAPSSAVARWRLIEIEYTTDKVAHYGGRCRSPLVTRHAHTNEEVLRFAEPLNELSVPLNPISLSIAGVEDAEGFLEELTPQLYAAGNCYAHEWQPGDILLADNRALLHGRNAYSQSADRCLQRVHIL